jgi:hypothetical protein
MGKYGSHGKTKTNANAKAYANANAIEIFQLDDKSIIIYLDTCLAFIREDIYKLIKKTDDDLKSILDEISAEICQTKYLFEMH